MNMNHQNVQMNVKSLLLLCLFVAGAFCACNKDDIDARLLKEEEELTAYITAEFGDAAIFLGGGAWLVKHNEEEEGATVEAGNYILWNRQITNHITGELEYTSDVSNNKFPDSYVKGGPEITVVQSTFPIDDGLKLMRKGESGDVYIPSRHLIRDFQTRVYSVEIVDVIKDLSVYQEGLMYGYIRKLQHRNAKVDTIKNVVSTIDKTEYNVMYYVLEMGSGDAISEGTNIETKTTTSYLIQEDNVHEYTVNQDKTWSTKSGEKNNTLTKTNCVGEILKKMNKGGKVVVTMPSRLLWEDKDLPKNKQNGQFYIPKWSVVVFTITIK
jgi:FKBP-type peptidyl-prolyl cis-trans isomerase